MVVNEKGTCPFGRARSWEVSELFMEEILVKQVCKAKGSGFWNELGECFR